MTTAQALFYFVDERAGNAKRGPDLRKGKPFVAKLLDFGNVRVFELCTRMAFPFRNATAIGVLRPRVIGTREPTQVGCIVVCAATVDVVDRSAFKKARHKGFSHKPVDVNPFNSAVPSQGYSGIRSPDVRQKLDALSELRGLFFALARREIVKRPYATISRYLKRAFVVFCSVPNVHGHTLVAIRDNSKS